MVRQYIRESKCSFPESQFTRIFFVVQFGHDVSQQENFPTNRAYVTYNNEIGISNFSTRENTNNDYSAQYCGPSKRSQQRTLYSTQYFSVTLFIMILQQLWTIIIRLLQ